MTALNIGGYAVLFVGIVLVIVAVLTYKRKDEAEVSQSLIEVPYFKVGIVAIIIGIIMKLLVH